MSPTTRKRLHFGLAIFFMAQVPVAIALQFLIPDVFEVVWKTYLIFLSIYAIVSTHLGGASAEMPSGTSARFRFLMNIRRAT